MAISPPTGFLTRPEASKIYNRSQRALERDLDIALAIRDANVLAHWMLVTKDGQERPAGEVTTELVKKLVADGMSPAWSVEEAWLEEQHGRKGAPKPPKHRHVDSPIDDGEARTDHQRVQPGRAAGSQTASLPNDLEFLKERIRTLERENREEATRSEQRENKLFEQLAVKDKQISAWDEVTQGVTKALATGQIRPSLASGHSDTPPHDTEADNGKPAKGDVREAEIIEQNDGTTQKSKDASGDIRTPKKPGKATVTRRKTTRPSKATTRSKQSATRHKRKPNKETPEKPKWYETPTLNRFLSRK